MKLTLTTKFENPRRKNETTFLYHTEEHKSVMITAHPTVPFGYYVDSQCKIANKNKLAIIDEYIKSGVKQHTYKGGFDEAISILEINI